MLPPAIERLTESNISGGCYLQLVKATSVGTMPEEVNGTIEDAIVLSGSAFWTEVRPTLFTQDFDEEWKRVDGAQVAVATLECVIPKDRAILLHELWRLHTGRYLVIHHDKNGNMKLLGTKEEPATVRMVKLQHGTRIGVDRNQYLLQVTVSRRTACPFYDQTPPSNVPADCPTMAALIADAEAADIAAAIPTEDVPPVLTAILSLPAATTDLIVEALGNAGVNAAVLELMLSGLSGAEVWALLSPTQQAELLEAANATLCDLIEAAFLAGGTGELVLTVGATSGELTETGTLNSKPLYFIANWASTGFSAEAYWTGTEWYMTNGVLEWTSSEDVATPADVVTWTGDSPLPTIAAGSTGADTIAACVPLDQVDALIAALGGGSGADAHVELNGTPVADIASGATLDIAVLQDGSPVGSLVGSDWVIPPAAPSVDRYYPIAIGHP